VAKRKTQKDEPLNLVPIMNLVTILIPALLIAVKAVTLTMIETKLPAIGPPPDTKVQETEEDKPLAPQVIIGKTGITLNKPTMEFYFDGEIPPEYTSENPPPLFPCTGPAKACFNPCTDDLKQTDLKCFNYEFKKLTEALVKVKKKALADGRFDKTSPNLVLMPEKDIPYIVIIQTMDAARGTKDDQAIFENQSEAYKRGLFKMISFAGGLN